VYARNQNYICVVDGPTGSGKSYTCLGLGEMQSPRFDAAVHVVFDILMFVQLVRSDKVQQGDVVIFEEVGVAASNRSWFLPENKWLSFINQIFRTKNLIVYYNAPEAEMAEKNLLRLAHAKIETQTINREEEVNVIKVFDPAKYNARKNEWYRQRVGFRRLGKTYKVDRYRIARPSIKTIRIYEKMREAYLNTQTAMAEKELIESKDKASRPTKRQLSPLDITVIAREIMDSGTDYMDDSKFNHEKVMDKWNMGSSNARRVKQRVKELLKENGRYAPWAN